jgi:hypothetical protein
VKDNRNPWIKIMVFLGKTFKWTQDYLLWDLTLPQWVLWFDYAMGENLQGRESDPGELEDDFVYNKGTERWE